MAELKKRGLIPCAIATFGLSVAVSSAPAHAGSRSFSEFLAAQGTYCIELDGLPGCDLPHFPEPEIITFTGPAPTFNLAAVVDYAGLHDKALIANGNPSLGTAVSGQVNERRLSDGRAEVQVTFQSKNALTYVLDVTSEPSTVIYGRRLVEVLAGAEAALSDCSMQLTLINPAPGAPLPDLYQAAFFSTEDQFIKSFGITCNGQGELASGGSATFVMRQTVTLFRTPFRGANSDGAPVEVIALKPLAGSTAFDFRELQQQ